MKPTCATCYYWYGTEGAHRAPCGIDAVYGDPAFNDGCPSWRPRGVRVSITLRSGTIAEVTRQLDEARERLRGMVE